MTDGRRSALWFLLNIASFAGCMAWMIKTDIPDWVPLIVGIVFFVINTIVLGKEKVEEEKVEEDKTKEMIDKLREVLSIFDAADMDIEEEIFSIIPLLQETSGRLAYDQFPPKKVLYVCFLVLAPFATHAPYPDGLKHSAIWTIYYYEDPVIAIKVLKGLELALESNSFLYEAMKEAYNKLTHKELI